MGQSPQVRTGWLDVPTRKQQRFPSPPAEAPHWQRAESGDWPASYSIDQQENLLLVGPSGTGKTHVAKAPAACPAGRKVWFFRLNE